MLISDGRMPSFMVEYTFYMVECTFHSVGCLVCRENVHFKWEEGHFTRADGQNDRKYACFR